MITVRSPAGVSVQFNTANYIMRYSSYTDIYTQKDGSWVAQVPNDWLIEVVKPCRVYRAAQEPEDLFKAAIEELRKRPGDWAASAQIADLKHALVKFDARRRCWK